MLLVHYVKMATVIVTVAAFYHDILLNYNTSLNLLEYLLLQFFKYFVVKKI